MTATALRRPEFAALHRPGHPFLLPNAWDVASALLIGQAGFPAVGTTSLGVTAAAGLVDGAGTGRACTLALAAAVGSRLAVPFSVDIEAGYSDDPDAVAGLAAELASLGAAGINLEDAAAGARLRPVAAQAAIIRSVVAAAPVLFVNARTDTYWLSYGPQDGRLAETITRLRAYADAGASGAFVPGCTDVRVVSALTSSVPVPLNVLWQPGVQTRPLAEAGVARISTGSAPYRRALAAGLATAVAARDGGQPPEPDLPYAAVLELLAPRVAANPDQGSVSTPRSSA